MALQVSSIVEVKCGKDVLLLERDGGSYKLQRCDLKKEGAYSRREV